jgi:peptidyl-prolyl cis-trans isomerase SurA
VLIGSSHLRAKALRCGVALLALGLAAPALAQGVDLATPPAASLPTAAPPAVAKPAPIMTETVAALINDEIVSTYDLRERVRLMVLTSGVQPTADSLQQIAQEALRSLTDERLEMQEMQRIQKRQKDNKTSLIATDKEVDDEIANLAKSNNLTYDQLKASFAAAGVDIQSLRAQIRTQISWQRLVGGMYGSRIRVGNDQVSTELRRLANAASQPQYLISEIVIDPVRVGGDSQAMSGAQQLIAQLQKGAPFPAVARQFSAATTAANGGDAGWVSASQEPPEVAQTLDSLHTGQLSAPIVTSNGVYVIYLRDRLAAASQTLVDLKQMAIRLPKDASPEQLASATAILTSLKASAKGCAGLETLAGKSKGVLVSDLGEAEINDLSGPFKAAAQKLQPDEISDPIRTDVGLHLVAVCSKRSGGANVPTKAEIENRIYSEQLATMSRRYLRDLRTSADIETR